MMTTALLGRLAASSLQVVQGLLTTATTYASRATLTSTPTLYGPFQALWQEYQDHYIAMQALLGSDAVKVLREDKQVRVENSVVTWTPTLYDEIVHPDTSHWRILSIHGGTISPLWTFQVRKRTG